MSRSPGSQGRRPLPGPAACRAKTQIFNAQGLSPPHPPPARPSQVTLTSPYHADLPGNSLKPNLLLLKPPGYTNPAVLPGHSFWTLLSQGQIGPQAGPGPPCSAQKGGSASGPQAHCSCRVLLPRASAATLPSSRPNSSAKRPQPNPADNSVSPPGDARGLSLQTLPEEELGSDPLS